MSIVFSVLVILLTASTYNFCQISTCLDKWTGPLLPRPRDQSGECGRYCKDTWICDPCSEISNTTGTLSSFCVNYDVSLIIILGKNYEFNLFK